MVARVGLLVSAMIALAGFGLGIGRVGYLADSEVHVGHRTSLRQGARAGGALLASARLEEGTHAAFEICADDPMEAERWAGTMNLQISLDGEIGIDTALDGDVLSRVQRNERSACLVLGRGPVLATGEYEIAAAYDTEPTALVEIPIRGRIVARRELDDLDLTIVLVTWLGSLLIVVFLAQRSGPKEPAEAEQRSDGDAAAKLAEPVRRSMIPAPLRPALAVLLGLLGMLAFMFGHIFPPGAASSLAAGVTLGLVEVALAVVLVGGAWVAPRIDALALVRPRKAWWLWFPIAGVTGVLLLVLARLSTLLVPSTGTSSITMFVSWPSGMLSFAALAVAAPLAEEIFFRGFVYGALEKYHRAAGFLGAWLLFVAFHASQTWGEWGALTAITVTGLGLTSLRAFSGSALVAAAAHLTYNGLLASSAF